MKKLILLSFLCLAGCATGPEGLRQQNPDFKTTLNSKNLPSATECIFRKMEAYPVLIGFSFEDKTLPVQVRQFPQSAELLQMQNTQAVAFVSLQKTPHNIEAQLNVSNGSLIRERLIQDYSQILQSCR